MSEKEEELYRLEIILYKDSFKFCLHFPEPIQYVQSPTVYLDENEQFMGGLKMKGWNGILNIQSVRMEAKDPGKFRGSEQKVNRK